MDISGIESKLLDLTASTCYRALVDLFLFAIKIEDVLTCLCVFFSYFYQ